MRTLLEVIVTSVEDCIEAEAGGADRLELIADLEHAGLTPPLSLVESALAAVRIPIRVMLRDHPTMEAGSAADLRKLSATARQLSLLPIDGIVAGFVRDSRIDLQAMCEIIGAAPNKPITFHRAFEYLSDPVEGIAALKSMKQVDRILTRGEGDTLAERLSSLATWQSFAAPEITMLFAAGREAQCLRLSSLAGSGLEIHVGRAARIPQTVSGRVSEEQVASLRQAWNQ